MDEGDLRMIIMSSENDGQLGGFTSVEDLEKNKKYVMLDMLYMERGLLKVDETVLKGKFVMMFADKWSARPWSFTYAKGLCLDGETEIIGNVNILPGFYCIILTREFENIEPEATILFVNNVDMLNDCIDVTVIDKFHYGSMKPYEKDHAQGRVLSLSRRILDTRSIHPNIDQLFRRDKMMI
jgi:hypothetical protein